MDDLRGNEIRHPRLELVTGICPRRNLLRQHTRLCHDARARIYRDLLQQVNSPDWLR